MNEVRKGGRKGGKELEEEKKEGKDTHICILA